MLSLTWRVTHFKRSESLGVFRKCTVAIKVNIKSDDKSLDKSLRSRAFSSCKYLYFFHRQRRKKTCGSLLVSAFTTEISSWIDRVAPTSDIVTANILSDLCPNKHSHLYQLPRCPHTIVALSVGTLVLKAALLLLTCDKVESNFSLISLLVTKVPLYASYQEITCC